MTQRLYIGNLSYETTEQNLRDLFSQAGEIASVDVITDKYSGKGKGFAFVEMTNGNEATNAINALNGRDVNGRSLNVNEARPREERSGGFGGGGGGRGGNRGGGGGGGFGGKRREPRW